jgi:acetyl esterase/lipase
MSEEVLSRPAPRPDFTVRYGPHPDQIADVRMPPAGREPTGPLVVFIHGGFWRAAYDRSHTGPLAADLAARGYPVATIEYRRVGQPGGGWPGTLDDVVAAVERVPDLVSDRIGLDVSRPVLAGHSAGGHLALWYASDAASRDAASRDAASRDAASRDAAGPATLRGVLALAPVADLALAHRLGLGDGAVAALLGGGPADVPERYATAQPGRPAVPVVIVHGTEDDVVPVAVSRAYVCKGMKLIELPGVEHYALIDPHSSAWATVVGALGAIGT